MKAEASEINNKKAQWHPSPRPGIYQDWKYNSLIEPAKLFVKRLSQQWSLNSISPQQLELFFYTEREWERESAPLLLGLRDMKYWFKSQAHNGLFICLLKAD